MLPPEVRGWYYPEGCKGTLPASMYVILRYFGHFPPKTRFFGTSFDAEMFNFNFQFAEKNSRKVKIFRNAKNTAYLIKLAQCKILITSILPGVLFYENIFCNVVFYRIVLFIVKTSKMAESDVNIFPCSVGRKSF